MGSQLLMHQECPCADSFRLTTIGNEAQYSTEFSLEDVQQLCATAFPLHTSSAGSNASFSTRPSRLCSSQECAVSEQAPLIRRGHEVGRFEGEERLVMGR